MEGREEIENSSEGLSTRIKNELLLIYQEIMGNRDTRFGQGSILMIVMFIQLWGYIFDQKSNYPFLEDDFYTNVCYVFKIFRIYPLLENTPGYLGFAYSIIVLIILYFLSLFYISHALKVHKMFLSFPLKFLKLINPIFYWILLSPSIDIFISIYDCPHRFHEIGEDLECWKGLHLFNVFIFTLGFIGFVTIIIMISCLYNESRRSSTDILARLDSNIEIYLSVFRIILSILSIFCRDSSLHWLIVLFHLCGSLSFISIYFTFFPYYHIKISVLFGSGFLCYTWLVFHLTLAHFFGSLDYLVQTLIIIPLFPLSYPIIADHRKRFYKKVLLEYNPTKIKKIHHYDILIQGLLDLITRHTYDEDAQTLLFGILANHKTECRNPECPLNHSKDLYLPINDTHSKRDISDLRDPLTAIYFIQALFLEFNKSSKSTALFHIIYSNFLFYKMGNIHMSILELNMASKQEATLQESLSILRNKNFIQEFLYNKYKTQESSKLTFENIDITIVITFENIFGRFQKSIEDCASEHIEFWSQLDSLLPDLNILHKNGLNIITYTKETQELWGKLTKINSRYPKALHLFGYYLSEIVNDPEEGEKKLEEARGLGLKSKLISQDNDFELMFSDDTAVIVISGDQENEGKINKTNSGIALLFGYKAFEVYGHDISILMPHIIGKHHSTFLQNYFISGKERIMNRDCVVFAMKRSGFIFQITLVVKPVPSLREGIQYIGLIRPQNKDVEFILMDQEGKIDSLSEGITGLLGISSSGFFKENLVYIQFICPELLDLAKGKGDEVHTKLDLIKGHKELTFKVPGNLTSIVQKVSKNAAKIDNHLEEASFESVSNSSYKVSQATPIDSMNLGLGAQEFSLNSGALLEARRKNSSIPDIILKLSQLLKGVGGHSLRQVIDIRNLPAFGNILLDKINYNECEVEKKINCEISNMEFMNGEVRLKVLSIPKNKRYEQNSVRSSVDYDYVHKQTKVNPEEEERLKKIGLHHDRFKERKSIVEITADPSKFLGIAEIEEGESSSSSSEFSKEVNSKYTVSNSGEESKSRVLHTNSYFDIQRAENISMSRSNLDLSMGVPELNLTTQEIVPIEMHRDKIEEEIQKNTEEPNINIHINIGSRNQRKTIKIIESERERAPEAATPGNGGGGNKKEEDALADADIGSVAASKATSFTNFIRALRNSMYEKYEPSSIIQLKRSAQVVFLVLIVLASITFSLETQQLDELEDSVHSIIDGKERVVSLTKVGYNVRILELMNDRSSFGVQMVDPHIRTFDYSLFGYEERGYTMDYYTWTKENIHTHGTKLKEAQNHLSASKLKDDQEINPPKMSIEYQVISDIPNIFEIDCWSAVIGVVIHSFKTNKLELQDITIEQESVNYILTNYLNSILVGVIDSITSIEDKEFGLIDDNYTTFIILCICANLAILFSIFIIFPVVIKVRNNKEKMLSLFIEIPLKNIQEELQKCRKFLSAIKGDSNVKDEEFADELEEVDEIADEEGRQDESDNLMNDRKKRFSKSKKRNYKEYSNKNWTLMLKFLIFALFFASYYIYNFFHSINFLDQTSSIIDEFGFINLRQFQNGLLFCSQIEMVSTNDTVTIKNLPSSTFANEFLNEMVAQQELFLKKHADNIKYNDDDYNNIFDRVVLTNMCTEIYEGDSERRCAEFMGGILTKGLHSANLVFWDSQRQYNTQFTKLPPEEHDLYMIKSMLNDGIINNEILEAKYFTDGYEYLVQIMEDEMIRKFDKEHQSLILLFIFYLFFMLLVYFVIWTLFLESTRKALYTTKSMLTLIPPGVIQQVEKIKIFIVNSSKSRVIGLNV